MTQSKLPPGQKPAAGNPTDAAQTRSSKATKKSGTDSADSGALALEVGGRGGPEPTRYGDWENNGRCTDF